MPGSPTLAHRNGVTPWLAAAVVVMAAIAAFWNSLENGFVLDDARIVASNPLVQEKGRTNEIFTSDYWAPQSRSNLYRPLTILSLAWNFRVHGMTTRGYHTVNTALHALAAVLAFLVARRLLADTGGGLFAGLLFAVHPIHVEAVVPAVGRSECLSGALTMGALFAYLRSRERGAGWNKAVALCLFFAATLAKESSLALPLVLVLVEWVFPVSSKERAAGATQGGEGPSGRRGRNRRRFARPAAFFLVAAVSIGLRFAVLGKSALHGPIPFIDNPAAKLGFLARLYTAAGVTLRYLGLLVFPRRLSADYSYAEIEPITTPGNALFLVGIAVLVFLGTAVVLLRRRIPGVVTGAGFFALTYAPVSNVAVATGTIMAERLMYLPSFGVFLAAGGALVAARKRWTGTGGRAATAAAVSALVLLSARTIVRNRDFRNNEALFRRTVETSPRSAKMLLYYGDLLSMEGRFQEAQPFLARAERILPDYGLTQSFLGSNLGRMGRHEEALAHFSRAAALNPDLPETHRDLGNVFRMLGRLDQAESALRRSVALQPASAEAMVDLGAVLLMKGNLADAETNLRQALRLQPNSFDAHYNLGRALEAQLRYAAATASYRQALRINPVHPDAALGLAIAIEGEQKWDDAIRAYDGASLLRPGDPFVIQRKARLLSEQSRLDEAVDAMKAAIAIRPDVAQLWYNLGTIFQRKNEPETARQYWKKAFALDPGYAAARRSLLETGGLE